MELHKTWPTIKNYLSLGINIIPVRDKPTIFQGKTYDVKTPYSGWKKYQTEKITEQDLYFQLGKYNTGWAAFICGKISNNLFNIDIDTKHYKGFEAIYFASIRELFPDLWSKLRIHKTPSGGYHIIYFMESPPPGPKKLAERLPTPEEIIAYRQKNPNAKSDLKSVCFLETRGEGSLSGFTGDGYSIHIDNPIPTLSDLEHEALINLGQSYNQIVKIDTPYKPSKFVNDFFDENPFDHFNNSPEGEKVLENNGWTRCGHNSNFIWLSRPDSKSKGVHASFNLNKRCYYIFTSSTQFEPDKGYNPSTALSILQFRGDKKETFKYLQDSGFGKVNKHREQKIVKAKAKSKIQTDLPANFSEQAKEDFQNIKIHLKATYPFGTFWTYDEENKLVISRESLYGISDKLGFVLYRGELKILDGKILRKADERLFQDKLKSYIKEEDQIEYEDICNTYESFMQKNGKFTISRLRIIQDNELIRDNEDTCYKFFKNGYVEIKANAATPYYYDELQLYVQEEKIQNRDFNLYEGGKYIEYLSLATDFKNNMDHIQKCIGYLSHEYKDETTGYIIVLAEQCQNPKDGGGSGKNVFCNLLSHTTTYHSKNGAQAKFDEKFFQSWSGQRIMGISDVPKNFPYEFLKEPSTGTFILKKLFKDEVEIPVEDGPKFIIQTNFSYEITDGGLNRRIIPIEFTDFFTKCGGLDSYFGVHFPKGWTNEDWHGYDTFIIKSVQAWLRSGRKLSKVELTSTGWEKQFEQTYGKNMTTIIKENIEIWKLQGRVPVKEIRETVIKYLNEDNVPKMFWPSVDKQNGSIKAYCDKHGISFQANKNIKINTIDTKCHIFDEANSV